MHLGKLILVVCLSVTGCQVSKNEDTTNQLAIQDTLTERLHADSLKQQLKILQLDSLITAARKNDFNLVRDLINRGIDVNGKILRTRRHWESPLGEAVQMGNDNMIKLLIEYKADPNLDLGESGTPFLSSAGLSSISMFKFLYEHGGDIKTTRKNFQDETLLRFAISQGKIENVKFLIREKISLEPDSLDNYLSPLSTAVSSLQLEMIDLLLINGANINATFSDMGEDCIICPYRITVMHQVVDMIQWSEPEKTRSVLDLLLKYNPDLNIESQMGFTPLEHACFRKDTKLVDKLIEHGAKLTTERYSSIHCATMLSNYEMVEHLLQKGVDPNVKDHQGNTPLLVNYNCCGDGFDGGVSAEKRVKTIELLLNYGAKPDIKNDEGESFLEKCRNGYRKELKDLMIKRKLL